MLQTKFSTNLSITKVFLILSITILFLFLFTDSITAQNNKPKKMIAQVPYSLKGVSIQDSQTFVDIVHTFLNKIKGIKISDIDIDFSKEDKKKLETIYFSMTKEQQKNQLIGFRKKAKPLPKIVPTSEQLIEWENTNKYGLWIDNKHQTNNAVLSKYKSTDFSQVFISKLENNAKSHGLNKDKMYQIDLMTNDFYQTYYNESIANKDLYDIFFRNHTAKLR